MSRKLAVGVLLVSLVGLVVVLGAGRGWAQLSSLLGPEKEDLLYNGDLKTDSGGVKLTSWGSGKAEAMSDGSHYFVGPEVLKVETQGLYQGIVLRLTRPADLAPYLAAKSAFVQVEIMPAQYKRVKESPVERDARLRAGRTGSTRGGTSTRGGGGGGGRGGGGGGRGGGGGGGGGRGGGGGGRGGGGMRGLAPSSGPTVVGLPGESGRYQVALAQMRGGGGGGMRGGGGGGGGRGGGGGGGMRGGGGAGGSRGGGGAGGRTQGTGRGQTAKDQPQEIGFSAHNLRLVLYTDAGTMVANEVPIADGVKDDRGWYRLSWPVARFSQAAGATQVQAVGLFSDEAEVFYLGQVRLLIDRQAVKATVKADPGITKTGEVVEFSTELGGGAIDPEVNWDFDEGNGVQKQAVGPKVKYVFKKPGDYVVTATITDRSGVQPEIKKTTGVHVEQATEPKDETGKTKTKTEKEREPVIEVK